MKSNYKITKIQKLIYPEGSPGGQGQGPPEKHSVPNSLPLFPVARKPDCAVKARWRKAKPHQGNPQVYNETNRQISTFSGYQTPPRVKYFNKTVTREGGGGAGK